MDKVTKEALIADIQRLNKKWPGQVTRNFYRANGKFTESQWQRFFPKFGNFLTAAEVIQTPESPRQIETQELEVAIKKSLKKSPMSVNELSNSLNVDNKVVNTVVGDMQNRGTMVHSLPDGRLDLFTPAALDVGKDVHDFQDRGDGWDMIGFTSDNHLCNTHCRLDVLNAAYDFFSENGIALVVNGGNWIDGEAKFNKRELVVPPGMDNQLDYLIDNWPVRQGITTKFVAGDDHEGWYSQRENIEIGKYLQLRAEDQGRHDLKYLGYGEADIALRRGNNEAVMRLMHGGGGSAYALSYSSQKIVESFQGGEKPAICLVGHYHKFDWCYPREVNVVQMGCTCDQTLFMRKQKIQAHVGFGVIRFQQDPEDGHITRFAVEWFPFYDRGFYEKRFNKSGV